MYTKPDGAEHMISRIKPDNEHSMTGYKRTQYNDIQVTSGQHHEGLGRDHKEIGDKVIHGDLKHTGTRDKHKKPLRKTNFVFALIYPAGLRIIQAHNLIGSFTNIGDGSLHLTAVSTLCEWSDRVDSPGREDSASMKGNRTDNHTVSPDIMMEAQIKFHGMYEYICLSGPCWRHIKIMESFEDLTVQHPV